MDFNVIYMCVYSLGRLIFLFIRRTRNVSYVYISNIPSTLISFERLHTNFHNQNIPAQHLESKESDQRD